MPSTGLQHSTWSQEEVDDVYKGPSQSSDSNPLLPPVVASQEVQAPGAGLAPQLGKLGMLEAFDRAWDRRYPNETEERFEWPWQSLTLEQVALGRLDFRKFIVLRIWRRISATLRASTGVFLLTEKVVGNRGTSIIRMPRGRKRCLQVQDCAAMACKHGAAPGVWRRQSDTCLF